MAKDLRTFLARLEQRAPDELVRVTRPVDPKFELPGVVRRLQSNSRYPLIMFENVKGARLRAISNVLGSERLLAEALETTPQELTRTYIQREDRRLPVKEVTDAPVQEVVLRGDDVNLYEMPIVTNCEKDSGAFITGGITSVRVPDTTGHNSGIYRMQIHSRNTLGMSYEKHTHIGTIHRSVEARGEPLEAVTWVGHHPACLLGCQSKIPFGEDEFEVMGGLLEEPLEVVKAVTVDVMVPAKAEVVFEGRILPGPRLPEGPFGEFTWYYGLERPSPIMEVTAITFREDALYHHLFAAHPEHNLTGRLGRESILYKRVRATVPSVTDVYMPMSGLCRFHAYVQIKKEYDGAGRLAALSALSSDPFVKLAVVVDDDVDIHNEAEVLWAIATRTQPDRSTFFIPESATSRLDPASYSIWSRWEKDTMNTKWAIDATKPVEAPFEERADVPRDVWEKIDLEQYVEPWESLA
ncbi:MAG TPA: UbiD family decarboxylase [Actinomycetota bacterium]